ncbi:MAG: prepilin-type N-terminal cleavage/methylation domain-containing protein [Candidatus Sumerlaeaceae bacterium]|nr:prepilin-type N-terminal cleavage/methylation domain-containing protein [Candidatus Sumerlaeaceae bacterium]
MTAITAKRSQGGFTVLELLIAVIIIGILVAIIVPVYTDRAEQARLTAAQQDLDALKTAQEHAAIDTAYFYALYVLDDVRDFDGVPSSNPNDRTDGIRDEVLRTDISGDPRRIFIDTTSGQVPAGFATIFSQIQTSETNFNWNGPYVNYTRRSLPGEFTDVPADMPLDPWGRPYLFFTKDGYFNPRTLTIDNQVTINGTTLLGDATIFDRPTVLSLGADGASGGIVNGVQNNNFGTGDDLFRQF